MDGVTALIRVPEDLQPTFFTWANEIDEIFQYVEIEQEMNANKEIIEKVKYTKKIDDEDYEEFVKFILDYFKEYRRTRKSINEQIKQSKSR